MIPGIWDVDNATYHAECTVVGHSMLEDYRQSVRLYEERYITKTLQRDEPTPQMVLGTAVHALLLQPQQWQHLLAVAPAACDRRTKLGKETWERFTAECDGKTIIAGDQFGTALAMADAVRRNELAHDLLADPGRSELAIRWEGPHGVPCKAMFDRQLDVGISLDLKTAADPSPSAWPRAAASYGYHRQAALYILGREAVFGIHPTVPFYHLVIGNRAPYDCVVYQLDADALMLGLTEIDDLLRDLAMRRATDQWRGRWDNEVFKVSLPKWSFA